MNYKSEARRVVGECLKRRTIKPLSDAAYDELLYVAEIAVMHGVTLGVKESAEIYEKTMHEFRVSIGETIAESHQNERTPQDEKQGDC